MLEPATQSGDFAVSQMDLKPHTSISSCVVSAASETQVTPHPRLAEYKARTTINQEDRRRDLLEQQRRNRLETFNHRRHLSEDVEPDNAQECLDEDMEWKSPKDHIAQGFRLMLSEWLMQVPSDLAEKWYLVLCPEGRRTLVIATKGCTKAFTKHGKHLATFKSALPGGCVFEHQRSTKPTVLDCVWNHVRRTYYVLDVLEWNGHSFSNCDTECRFFWLKTKFSENLGLSEPSEKNKFPFVWLPFYPCDCESIGTVMASFPLFPDNVPGLDGLLFYHSETHYTSGSTPLVGWLKPFMLPDVLGMCVAPQYLEQLPTAWVDLPTYVATLEESDKRHKKRKRTKKHSAESMELGEVGSDDLS